MLRFIRRAKDLGFTLPEVAELLDLRRHEAVSCTDVRRRAEMKVADIEERITALAAFIILAAVSFLKWRKAYRRPEKQHPLPSRGWSEKKDGKDENRDPVNADLSEMRFRRETANAKRCLPVLPCLPRVRHAAQAESRRLLRFLQFWPCPPKQMEK